MNLQAVLQKTEKGVEEIATRKNKLEQKLRTILIVVNGKATAAELIEKFAQIGDVTPMVEQLLAGGYIQEVAGATAARAAAAGPSAEFKEVRIQLSQLLTDALGPPGDAIVMQFEACNTADEARAFVETHRPVLQRVVGPRGAAFLAKAKELLG
jgi:hypothetical protein